MYRAGALYFNAQESTIRDGDNPEPWQRLPNFNKTGSVIAVVEEIGPLSLKGLTQPVVAYNVPLSASQPALRVIEGGPQPL